MPDVALDAESASARATVLVDDIYARLEGGKDVSPAQLYRAEGQLNLLLEVELLDWDWLKALVGGAHANACGSDVEPLFWAWCHDSNVFRLPIKMQEAPVYRG